MTSPIETISAATISEAWLAIVALAHNGPGTNAPTTVLTVPGGASDRLPEIGPIRANVDALLSRHDKVPVDISAMTIFPYRLWVRRGRPACDEFSKLCVNRLSPKMKEMSTLNRHGLYFERMMSFEGVNRSGRVETRNQLLHVVNLLSQNKGFRRTALQLSCFDPAKDHSRAPRLGFPCLQQLSVDYDENGLTLTAMYPSQHLIGRAYGNYVGLWHLGKFLSHQTERPFRQLNCIIGRPTLDLSKRIVNKFLESSRNLRSSAPTGSDTQ